ncbi:MAG TPA: lysylphosphatidylglycerol synthase transmembrane domain-containing protein [Nocardioides sp.]
MMGRLGASPGRLRVGLGLLSSGLFVYLAVRSVDWARTAASLRDADWLLVAAGAVALVATFGVFAARWSVLLSGTARLPLRDTFSYVMIGYLANTVLPLRLGDVARATLLGRRHGLESASVLGSILLERVLDLLSLLLLILALSFVVDVPPLVRAGMTMLGGGTLAALIGMAALAMARDRLTGLAERLPRAVPRRPVERMLGLVDQFARGLTVLRDGRQLGQSLALSGLAWAVAGAGMYCWVEAFRLPVPWYAGLFVLAVINLGGSIPSSPGGIGVYHFMAVLALSVWVPDTSAALGFAIGTHGVNLLLNVAIGALCLAKEGLAFRSLTVLPNYRSVAPRSGAAPV